MNVNSCKQKLLKCLSLIIINEEWCLICVCIESKLPALNPRKQEEHDTMKEIAEMVEQEEEEEHKSN